MKFFSYEIFSYEIFSYEIILYETSSYGMFSSIKQFSPTKYVEHKGALLNAAKPSDCKMKLLILKPVRMDCVG